MASYVFSDVHGHAAPLERLLERVAPGSGDAVYMLGDMVDRGPEPGRCMQLVRDLPNCTTLMGNHEQMMLAALSGDILWGFDWERNGGQTTHKDLKRLKSEERTGLLEWVGGLPLHASCEVSGKRYLLTHAGILCGAHEPPESWDDASSDAYLSAQADDDLVWIRDGFWDRPTGLVGADGSGPVVIAGHTPTLYVEQMAGLPKGSSLDVEGRCTMLFLGASENTGGAFDKIAIDCAAAAGAGIGQIGMLRLDDMAVFYEPVLEGE